MRAYRRGDGAYSVWARYPRSVQRDEGPPPRLEIEAQGCEATSEPGVWRAAWLVENRGSVPVSLHSTWHPHGQFKAPEHLVEPAMVLEPGARVRLVTSAWCREPPDGFVENAFLILRVEQAGQPWRVFARVRVEAPPGARPEPEVSRVTVQPVGSGPLSA